MVGLEVGKSHFDPFPLVAGLLELRHGHQCACVVTGLFVDVTRHLAPRHIWAALRFQWAWIAIELARPIENGAAIVHSAGGPQHLAGRASVLILLLVECKIAAREGAIIPSALLPYRDVRGDADA